MKLAPTLPADASILINMSGRGDKDLDYVRDTYGADDCNISMDGVLAGNKK